MALKNIIPFGKKTVPVRRVEEHPFLGLRREMDRLFEDFFRGFFGTEPLTGRAGVFTPRLDITETDKELKIKAELPGIDEKDVEITLTHDTLTIRGEKKEEQEEKDGSYYRMERSYGSFSRTIPLPREVEQDKAMASFKKGVLTISLPKTAQPLKEARKIDVKAG